MKSIVRSRLISGLPALAALGLAGITWAAVKAQEVHPPVMITSTSFDSTLVIAPNCRLRFRLEFGTPEFRGFATDDSTSLSPDPGIGESTSMAHDSIDNVYQEESTMYPSAVHHDRVRVARAPGERLLVVLRGQKVACWISFPPLVAHALLQAAADAGTRIYRPDEVGPGHPTIWISATSSEWVWIHPEGCFQVEARGRFWNLIFSPAGSSEFSIQLDDKSTFALCEDLFANPQAGCTVDDVTFRIR